MQTNSLKQLEKLCKTWQARLRLQDWDVRLRLVKQVQMDDIETWGRCAVHQFKKIAEVDILFGDDLPNYANQEVILVHELLHLCFPSELMGVKIDPEDVRYMIYEQGIHKVSEALVEAYNG